MNLLSLHPNQQKEGMFLPVPQKDGNTCRCFLHRVGTVFLCRFRPPPFAALCQTVPAFVPGNRQPTFSFPPSQGGPKQLWPDSVRCPCCLTSDGLAAFRMCPRQTASHVFLPAAAGGFPCQLRPDSVRCPCCLTSDGLAAFQSGSRAKVCRPPPHSCRPAAFCFCPTAGRPGNDISSYHSTNRDPLPSFFEKKAPGSPKRGTGSRSRVGSSRLLRQDYSMSYSLESRSRWAYLSSATLSALANRSSARSGKDRVRLE